MTQTTQKQFLVLLTDDDEDDRDIFQETFEELDSHAAVMTLHDGQQLMDYLGDSANELPDLLFLDINMPHKNGHQCLKEIRQNSRLKDLCIIMYSTSDYPPDVKRAYDLGADAFIQKPTSHQNLKTILREVLDTDWKDPCNAIEENHFVLQP